MATGVTGVTVVAWTGGRATLGSTGVLVTTAGVVATMPIGGAAAVLT